MEVASLFNTVSRLWLLSRIFMYAFSVSEMVLSYSLRAVIFLASDSFILANLIGRIVLNDRNKILKVCHNLLCIIELLYYDQHVMYYDQYM